MSKLPIQHKLDSDSAWPYSPERLQIFPQYLRQYLCKQAVVGKIVLLINFLLAITIDLVSDITLFENPQIWTGQNRSPIFVICGLNNEVEHFRKQTGVLLRVDIMTYGMAISSNGHTPLSANLRGMAMPGSVRSALKRTPLQDFDFFSKDVLLHYKDNISKNWWPILPCSYLGEKDTSL